MYINHNLSTSKLLTFDVIVIQVTLLQYIV